jgi:hypothetical protein
VLIFAALFYLGKQNKYDEKAGLKVTFSTIGSSFFKMIKNRAVVLRTGNIVHTIKAL